MSQRETPMVEHGPTRRRLAVAVGVLWLVGVNLVYYWLLADRYLQEATRLLTSLVGH